MSAAESARTGHSPAGPCLAPVVPLSKAARRPRRTSSERTRVPAQPTGDVSPQQRLAATLEAVFARHRRSLTDESTAEAFLITLGEVRRLLHGALEQGALEDDQHETLDAMLQGMEAAPGLLTGHTT
jgi:hypothetical protein